MKTLDSQIHFENNLAVELLQSGIRIRLAFRSIPSLRLFINIIAFVAVAVINRYYQCAFLIGVITVTIVTSYCASQL